MNLLHRTVCYSEPPIVKISEQDLGVLILGVNYSQVRPYVLVLEYRSVRNVQFATN